MIILLSLGSTFFAVVLAQIGMKWIGAEKTSFLSTFEPLTSVILGALFLEEKVTLRTGMGVVCILISAGFLALEKKLKKGVLGQDKEYCAQK